MFHVCTLYGSGNISKNHSRVDGNNGLSFVISNKKGSDY